MLKTWYFVFLHIAQTGRCRIASWRFQAILGLTVALAGTPSAIRGAETMRVAIENSAEPLSFARADGGLDGFAVDLIHSIAAEMNFTLQPIAGNWEEILTRFKNGEADILLNVAYTKERDTFLDFTVAHLKLESTIFVRKGFDAIRTASDLANVRVAMQRESISHEYLRARGWDRHPVFVRDFHDALRAVEDGRCDAVAAVSIIGTHVIRTNRLQNVVSSGVPLADFTFSLHMAVHAGDADRLAILNDGLARIRANGAYDRLHEKWIGPLEPRRLRFADVRPYLLLVFTAAIILGGALWWQRRLLRRLAEQAEKLRESENRLRHVLDGSEDAFWDWDMRTNHIERSERWAAMLGYTLAEIPPTLEGGRGLVHPDDLARHETWQARLHGAGDARYDLEYRMKAKSGEWRWILDRGKVVARAPDGRPLRMAGTHSDITERKRTEAALMESQALLKRSAQLLEQSQKTARVGGWETDLRTGRVYWTAETYRIHETTPEDYEPTRESVYAFYLPESRQRLTAAAEKAVRDGTSYSIELEMVTARHRRIHVHTAGVAEKEEGRIVKLYGSFRDITAEKMAEQEREHLRLKMLEAQKLESLGVLAGGIAHDFNNLLTVVLANASLLRSERTPDDERLTHIEAAARRAADLCRQMLAYAGKGSFVIEPLDLGALVRDTAELIHVSISKKARLDLALAPQLPSVDADPSQLRQLVMNLVINASEALGDAAGEIRIETSVGRPDLTLAGVRHVFDLPEGDCVCLEVSDTGSGMSPATLARIFDPFFTTKFAGRGLGLAAVLGIVRAHRGALTVNSVPACGSRFRLYLPVSTRRVIVGAAPARIAPPSGPARGTILIADDERIVLETSAALLRRAGYETVLAADGHQAVARFRESADRYTAVLLDLTMPGLDGADVLRTIRTVKPDIPALVMSGFSEKDVLERLHGLGRVAILRKPFTHEVLIASLAEVAKR